MILLVKLINFIYNNSGISLKIQHSFFVHHFTKKGKVILFLKHKQKHKQNKALPMKALATKAS